MSYIIVLGNEKGGTGKSTLSMHLAVNLLRMGCKVGTIDIDARQGTLSRYIENRKNYIEKMEFNLPQTQHIRLYRSEAENVKDAQNEDIQAFEKALSELSKNDFLVIDTPGSDTFLSRLAHSHADTVITPLNDSFIDLDMLVRLDFIKNDILKPSIYAEMIWEQKKEKAIRNKGSIDWIVVRNRLSNIQAKNKLEMERILNLLCKRIGFRQAAGFGERVIFRELFLKGLTLLDLEDTGQKLSLSHVTARQELRNLIEMINLPIDSIQKEEKTARG